MRRAHERAGPAQKPAPFLKDNRWHVNFRVGGHGSPRYRRSFATPGEAQAFIDRVLAGKIAPVKAMLPGLIDEYLRWSERVRGKTPATMVGQACRLRIFQRWAAEAGVRQPGNVDYQQFTAFQNWFFDNSPFRRVRRRGGELNTRSNWQTYRRTIATFYVWLIKQGHAKENPAADKDFKEVIARKIPPHFRPEELAAVFKYFDDRDADLPVPWASIMIRLLAYTGMRIGEAMALAWEDVDPAGAFLRVRLSKNKTFRTIPINPKLWPWLDRLPRIGPRVFDDGHGGAAYTRDWYLKQLTAACRDLKIPHRRLHDLRHTFGAAMVRTHRSLVEAKYLLGHKRIETTLQYSGLDADGLKEAIDDLDY